MSVSEFLAASRPLRARGREGGAEELRHDKRLHARLTKKRHRLRGERAGRSSSFARCATVASPRHFWCDTPIADARCRRPRGIPFQGDDLTASVFKNYPRDQLDTFADGQYNYPVYGS